MISIKYIDYFSTWVGEWESAESDIIDRFEISRLRVMTEKIWWNPLCTYPLRTMIVGCAQYLSHRHIYNDICTTDTPYIMSHKGRVFYHTYNKTYGRSDKRWRSEDEMYGEIQVQYTEKSSLMEEIFRILSSQILSRKNLSSHSRR